MSSGVAGSPLKMRFGLSLATKRYQEENNMRVFWVLLTVALLVALAFWLGWFRSSRTTSPDKNDYHFTIDKKEIQRDVERAEEQAREAAEKAREKLHDATR
jgi:hypothetical protein